MTAQHMMLALGDWHEVTGALPELNKLDNVRDQFKVALYDDGGTVEPDGLYLVLEGQVSLRLRGEEVGKARLHDFFFEEYLVVDDTGTQLQAYALPGTRLLKLNQANWATLPADSRELMKAFMFGDLVNVHMHDFQQPINCCNITAAAFSLTALGYPTHVDDIFRDCNLPTAYVVNSGLTLGEMYDVACTYVHRRGLTEEVAVQCHYFDEELVSEQDFLDALAESDQLGGEHDILVANFGVGIAHDRVAGDGGHFALIAKCNRRTGIVHMVDVHPEKYGKMWVTNASRLYKAMVQRDGSSLRARGLLRFSARDAAATRLSTFDHHVTQVDMTDHLDVDRSRMASFFQRSTTNLNSLGTLALAIRLLGRNNVDTDELMRAADIAPSRALSFVPTTEMLAQAVQRYMAHVGSDGITCHPLNYAEHASRKNENVEAWFERQLARLADEGTSQIVINIDINKVLGCDAVQMKGGHAHETPLLREFWCICTGYDTDTGTVTVTDISSATTQVWKTPANQLFGGLEGGRTNPSILLMQKTAGATDRDVSDIVNAHPLVLFYSDDDPWSYMLQSVLANIGVTELHSINVTGSGDGNLRMKQQLIADSGRDDLPYLYFQGECLGEVDIIVQRVKSGSFQEMLQKAGLDVLTRTSTPSLDKNIYGYPKGGLTDAPDARKNVLLCCCGSSAADKIPELVERLVAEGHDVKLLPTGPAEHFFKDIGMERILQTLRPSDIYRDDDEWNFRYTEFGMPVRACHLALCDWADCVVVAPITCNSMGKIAGGVGDSLLTSVFVAWQYQKKPVILCPACNTHMWNNVTTQNNVAQLKRLGASFEGPRSGILSNGTVGTGMMASVDEIAGAVKGALGDLDNHAARVMRWGAQAAAADDHREWLRIFRCIDEDVVGVNVCSDETGDTLLHYAAGGEGEMLEHGIERGVPDIEAAQDLVARGIDVNIRNDYNFTPLHVAIMNNSPAMVQLLLQAGADAEDCVDFAHSQGAGVEVIELIDGWAEDHGITIEPSAQDELPAQIAATTLYFTYGSLKRGFPNHEAHADILTDFVGEAVTRQALPLIVPDEPNCTNPNCQWLHRMPALVDLKGKGSPVTGEVYRLTEEAIRELDELEGFHGPGRPDNVYERKVITVRLNGELSQVQTYFIADAGPQLAAWREGASAAVADYSLEMAAATPKESAPDP